MNLLETIKESLISSLEQLGMAWWVEIVTDQPKCIYYFGPFATLNEAQSNQAGYIEDLEHEEAQDIAVTHKRGKFSELTIESEELRLT